MTYRPQGDPEFPRHFHFVLYLENDEWHREYIGAMLKRKVERFF
jgi:hypothetical protein